MVASVRGSGNVVTDGSTSSKACTTSPAVTAATQVGDRVFIVSWGTQPTLMADVNWTALITGTPLGGGSLGASTGSRYVGIWWRDWDAVWTMPAVTMSSASAPSMASVAVSVAKGAGESFSPPTEAHAAMGTGSTALSIASPSVPWDVGNVTLMCDGFPSTTTTASGTITAPGVTFGTKGNTLISAGTTSGNDVAQAIWYAQAITVGATAIATHTATLGTARTAGCVFVQQGLAAAAPTKAPPPRNPWQRLQPLLVR